MQIHNLPLAAMSQEVGLQVGRRLGVVHEVDVDREGLGWGRCLWVRVDIELSKPLMRGKMLSIGGKKTWLPFKYERLQNFCFKCGIVEHVEKECVQAENYSKEVHIFAQQYGP